MQFVPFGRSHENPPTTKEVVWDSPETADLMQRACYDCHSNRTVWPWYSNVAPISWLVQRDVNGGRRHLNFSEWEKPSQHAKDVANQVNSGEMPPWFYLPMHPNAKLSDADVKALMAGAERSLGPQTGPYDPKEH
ncbi:MAG: heme-binding domain-containing protein [Acidobacteriota bacterium]